MTRESSHPLYRKAALEHISAPEQLNSLIQVTTPKSWIILLTLCGLLLGVIIWSIFGAITTRVGGEGILLVGEGGLYNAVAPKGNARITRILVQPGDKIQKNQIVAILESPELSNQIAVAQQALTILLKKYQDLLGESTKASQQRHQELAAQTATLKNVVIEQTKNLEHIQELLTVREDAFKKGLVAKQDVVASWQDYYRTRREIQSAQQSIVQNQIDEQQFVQDWSERLRQLDLTIRDKTQELNGLKAQLASSKYIYSPIAGRIASVRAQLGDMVKDGEAIATISPDKSSIDVVAYIPVEKGKKVKPGMKALVSPSIIKKEEYGSINGTVTFVAAYPSSPNDMQAILQNEDLVKRLLEQRLPLEVRVKLKSDRRTYSGLSWTSAKGPPQKITPGTIIDASIIVRRQAPITLVIPAIKKLFGAE